jgi:hypothetical protein
MAATVLCLATSSLFAQAPAVHYQYPQGMPPGAIGSQQLQRGGPLQGFFQPVEIRAPKGTLISLAEDGRFGTPQAVPVRVGLLVGHVYRICFLSIPNHAGTDVFPTIELVNRLYTPRGQELRFPVVVELTQEDLVLAIEGKFVTRVVYLEEPTQALPTRTNLNEQDWFEIAPGRDPLAVADVLGRPMAIVRLGGRVPDRQEGPDMAFLYGCPPVIKFPARAEATEPSQSPSQAHKTARKPETLRR